MTEAPVFLPGEFQGQGSLVGCCLWGHTESDTTEAVIPFSSCLQSFPASGSFPMSQFFGKLKCHCEKICILWSWKGLGLPSYTLFSPPAAPFILLLLEKGRQD